MGGVCQCPDSGGGGTGVVPKWAKNVVYMNGQTGRWWWLMMYVCLRVQSSDATPVLLFAIARMSAQCPRLRL